MRVLTERLVIGAALAASFLVLGLQAFVLRPHLWPGGAGLALSGDTVLGTLGAPRAVAVIRPPDVGDAAGTSVTVLRVGPDGPAHRAGIRVGDQVRTIASPAVRIALDNGLPSDAAGVLHIWRDAQRIVPGEPLRLQITTADGASREVTLEQRSIFISGTAGTWLRLHLGPLSQLAAFLAGACALLALGAHGTTALLTTLALIVTGAANSGPLLGADAVLPVLGPLLLVFNWLITAVSFPIIGLAVLYFPHRAEILHRHRWIIPAMITASLPMFAIGVVSAAFLSGVDAVLPAMSWIATHGWAFGAAFAVPLGVNVLIVVEGITRYRINLDADERRRIQIVVFTGVPAVFAYALKTGLPLALEALGSPFEMPWLLEGVLQAIVLLPAFALPYAVAVRRVLSPRTVLRQSLQYAFARRTLTALGLIPIVALAASLVQQRDQSLTMIVGGRPLFYLFFLAMLGVVLRYRDAAQRWVDRQFFRDEYDAREILVSLAGRVPYEADPRELVAMVVTQIDSALHPECIAVLAPESPHSTAVASFEPVTSLRVAALPLRGDSGVITLLRWSDKPLEVFLDDEQSPVARVPPPDRAWLAAMNAALLVPIFAGGSDPRPFVGLIALGQKRSEEPFTPEDRELLRGIAVQMGVALDLSRLRKQVGAPQIPVTPGAAGFGATQTFTPTVAAGGSGASAISVGTIVDGKYRVDAMIGRGGMGAVFRAWDVRLERAVAIKVVRADLIADPDSRMRFRRESQIVARLQHPSIVTVFDYGTLSDGSAFLVMEFVPGEDLRLFLRREGRIDSGRMAALMTGICGGVEVAHKSGVFHRDLKPENILLPQSGTGPKVADFGVAKLTTSNPTDTSTSSVAGTIVGTPAYMAPEQLRGEAVDARADVFSLGVMAFEMLTARLPYTGASLFDIGMQQVEGKVDTKGIDPALADLIRKSIAYDRDARPASAVEFAASLDAAAR